MDSTTASIIVSAVVGLGLAGGIGMGVKAWLERGQLRANADSIVAAAARELLDPLRKELAQERADHAGEIEVESRKVAEVRAELAAARGDVKDLRTEIAAVRAELTSARAENVRYQERIRVLEGKQ